MSAAGSHTIEVCTFSSSEPVAVQIPHGCTVAKAMEEIRKKIGLQQSNLCLFGVFLGPLETPTKLLLDSDVIPTGAEVLLKRWNFNTEREIKLVRKDNEAISLLYNEARYGLDRGRIHPSDSQLQELEAFTDPTFPTERQYLELVCTIPGYSSYVYEGCKVLEDVISNDVWIPNGTIVNCVLDIQCLAL